MHETQSCIKLFTVLFVSIIIIIITIIVEPGPSYHVTPRSSLTHQMWNAHLTLEVEWIVKHSQALGDLHQERVMMALALTLVKGVCERTPHMLRSLFQTTLQYFSPQGL